MYYIWFRKQVSFLAGSEHDDPKPIKLKKLAKWRLQFHSPGSELSHDFPGPLITGTNLIFSHFLFHFLTVIIANALCPITLCDVLRQFLRLRYQKKSAFQFPIYSSIWSSLWRGLFGHMVGSHSITFSLYFRAFFTFKFWFWSWIDFSYIFNGFGEKERVKIRCWPGRWSCFGVFLLLIWKSVWNPSHQLEN